MSCVSNFDLTQLNLSFGKTTKEYLDIKSCTLREEKIMTLHDGSRRSPFVPKGGINDLQSGVDSRGNP